MRRRLLHVALLLGIATLACGRHAASAPAAAAKRDRVTLNLNPSLTYAPLMIAKDEGFFAQEGIDVELVALDSNSAIAACAVGKLDVLAVGLRAGLFNMMLRGAPLQIVADKSHGRAGACQFEAFVAPAPMADRIAAKGGDLRGERVGMVRGGVAELLTLRLLALHHRTPADVVMLSMPQGSAVSSREKVDAVRYLGEPNLSSLVADGSVKIVATPQDVLPNHQSTVLVYGKRLLRDDPALGRRFMRAYLRGVRRYHEGMSARNVAIFARYMKLPPEVIAKSCTVGVADDGHIDPAGVQPFLDWALSEQYLDGPVPLATWWNPTFVDAAARDLDANGR